LPIRRRLSALAASLLALLPWGGWPPARAADELLVQIEGLEIPIDLKELEAWSRQPDQQGGSQVVWLNLLDPQARLGLSRLLRAPLLLDRSFGRELLQSWTGQPLLREAGGLLQGANGQNLAPELEATLQALFNRQSEVSSLDLLRALPSERLVLRVDGLLDLAALLRDQLRDQAAAIEALRRAPLPLRHSSPLLTSGQQRARPQQQLLTVAHRVSPLPLELWPAQGGGDQRPLLLLMPGLGGTSSQLSWLAGALALRGWPVVVVEHPGSDEAALKASLEGAAPPPGAESVPARLADLQAVLAARREGRLGLLGESRPEDGVVLIGHSLGGLAALMAAGLVPEAGLGQRCEQALVALPLTNLSRLLQCQLPTITGDGSADHSPPGQAGAELPQLAGHPLRGVMTFNSFGSLLWPQQGLAALPVPVLMVGGSLDLITPPVQEQLDLLLSSGHRASRLVLVDGASHFSPVRLSAQGRPLFRLGQELVGEDPERVQSLLLQLSLEFLESGRHPALLSAQRRQHGGVTAYVLDVAAARRWKATLPPLRTGRTVLRNAPVGRATPPAGPR
jgi:predicted dienelactone hydrolase